MLKRLFKILRNIILVLVSILALLVILVNIPAVQNYAAQEAVRYFSRKLNTKVTLDHIRFHLFNSFELKDLYIEDQQGDTLLFTGTAELSITDWFFLRPKPVITHIGLEQAVIYLRRPAHSDQWNYDFITDIFSTKRTATPGKTDGTIGINLRKIELKQVRFLMEDQWLGTNMEGIAGSFALRVGKMDFRKKKMDIRSITGAQITFGLVDYPAGRPKNLRPPPGPGADPTPFNPGLWQCALDKLELKDSRFYLEKPGTPAPLGLFDEDHLDITGIDLQASGIQVRGDTLKAHLKHLAAWERCGLEIKKMNADIRVSPNISECKNLYLATGNSILQDYYAMQYDRFPDFLDYINRVNMSASLARADIGLADIAYFAPQLKRFDKLSVNISGTARGTVARLSGKNLVLNDGFSQITGSLNMNGLPDIHTTFMDFRNVHLQTHGAAALFYAPGLNHQQAVNLNALQQVDFKGSFTGFITDFVAYGTFITNLGNLRADLNMKLPARGRPAYSGTLSATNFDLGALLYQEDYMGAATFSTEVRGSGFNRETVSLKMNGNIEHFFINDYDYQAIKLAGQLHHQLFDGYLKVNDPNVMLDFSGKIDFQRAEPLYDFEAEVSRLNLKPLHFTQDNIHASGKLALNLKGHSIDDVSGRAFIYRANIYRDSLKLKLDSLALLAGFGTDGQRQLTLTTHELHAGIFGDFSIMELPNSFQMFLSYYLPQYVEPPETFDGNQNFRFAVNAGDVSDMLSLFDRSLSLGAGFNLEGSLDMRQQHLALKGMIPYMQYDKLSLADVQVSGKGNYGGLRVDLTANGMQFAEEALLSTIQFSTRVFQDSARFQLLTTSPTSLAKATLNGLAYARADSFYMHITPSRFSFNNNEWTIDAGNRITLAPGFMLADNLHLHSGLQHVYINTPGKSRLHGGDNLITLSNMDLAPLSGLLGAPGLDIDGVLNGVLSTGASTRKPLFTFDMQSSRLSLNQDTLGTVRLSGSYDLGKGRLRLNPESGINYRDARAQVSGTLDLNMQMIGGHIELDNAEASWLSPLLTGYVHQVSGRLNGNIELGGSVDDPLMSGRLSFHKLGFVPDITGVHYEIKEGGVAITASRFDLDELLVYDDFGNTAALSGYISHQKLKDMNFRIRLSSGHIQALNLNKYQSAHFYGNVFSEVQMRVTGPLDNLNMTVFATPASNSKLYIPISSSSDFGNYGYISFKKYGTDPVPDKPDHKYKFNFRLDAIATPDLETTIILDPATGDQIWAKGSGNIILDIPSDGEMKMNGNYIISEGTYDFSFKQLQILNYHRQFTINSNSIIKWNGDITDADLDVSAYATVKARLYDLIQGDADRLNLIPEEIQDAQIKQNVNVLMKMKGSLSEPDLSFNIELTEGRSIGTYAYQVLQRINADEKQTLIQVSSLLLLDQFAPPGGINSSAISSGTINNMSELLSSAASSQITNFANKILGLEDLTIGVRYKNYSFNNTDQLNINRNEAGINLRTDFLNDRLIVEAGGVYDWGRVVGQSSYTDNLAGDFRVQYLLTPDGKIRFSVFRTSDYDAIYLRKNVGRQGLGISYRRSFNGLGDFFRSKPLPVSGGPAAPAGHKEDRPAAPSSGRLDSARLETGIRKEEAD